MKTTIINLKELKNSAIETYEVITEEVFEENNFDNLTISGSLLSQNIFKNVTFVGTVFFGSKIEDCEFIGCTFINCKFQFTDITKCKFTGNRFENCTWICTTITNSLFLHTELDAKTAYNLDKGENDLKNCFQQEVLTWDDVLEQMDIAA